MLGRTGRLLAFGLMICLLALSLAGLPAAGAEGLHRQVDNPVLETTVELGYGGRITYGKPFPVRVTIRNSGEDLEGVLAVNGYVSTEKYDRYETAVSVPAGGERTYVLSVTAEIQQGTFTAEILRDGEVIQAVNASPDAVINPSAMMVGVLSTRPRNLAVLDISQENDPLLRYEYWQTVEMSPEILPDDPELLSAFGMIVLDDIDPAQLTEKQKTALTDWIRKGHVLLCGGGSTAPQNLAFLSGLLDLRAEDFTVSDGVYAALESFSDRRATNTRSETAIAVITGADSLISDKAGNGLVWRVPAGSGRVYVLAWEAGDAALNAESGMRIFYQQLLVKSDPSLYNSILYSSGNNAQAFNAPGTDSRVPVRNTLPLAAIIVAAVMVAGGALWIILQRKGAAKWMWLAVPVLSLAAAAAVALLSVGSPLNRSVAAASVNMVQDAEGNITRYTAVTAASSRAGLRRYALEGEDIDIQVYDDYYYWYEDEEAEPKEPVKLRSVRTSGIQREAAVNTSSAWEWTEFHAARVEENIGRVDAEIWMEQDGFHGTVTNNTSYSLKQGTVVCVYGFVTVPALKPGESADFALLQAEAKDPLNPVYEDGKMFMNVTSGLYSVIYSIWSKDGELQYDSRENMLSGLMNAASDQLEQNRNPSGSGQSSAVFFYSAEPESVDFPVMYADGEPVESVAVIPLLTAEVQYRTVGRTGIVFHTPGMDKAVRCNIDSNGLPAGDMVTTGANAKYSYNYYSLAERPTFRFSPEGLEDMQITSLIIGMERWYLNDLKCYVLNIRTKTWVEFTPNTPLQLPSQYIDSDGNLYCQFRSVTGDSYMDIPAPTLTLEGRVKDAEP